LKQKTHAVKDGVRSQTAKFKKEVKSGIIQMTNKGLKAGRAGSPLPAERVGCQPPARTE